MLLHIDWPAFVATLVTFATGFAASFKLYAWWTDRKQDSQFASAQALANQQGDESIRDFGLQELQRQHFARLTGINRPSLHHRAIVAAHRELGGWSTDWRVFRNAQASIRVVRGTMSVRRPRRRNIAFVVLGVLASLACAIIAAGLFTVAIMIAQGMLKNGVSLDGLTKTILSGTYAMLFSLFGVISYKLLVINEMDAIRLRKRLASVRLGRKRNRT